MGVAFIERRLSLLILFFIFFAARLDLLHSWTATLFWTCCASWTYCAFGLAALLNCYAFGLAAIPELLRFWTCCDSWTCCAFGLASLHVLAALPGLAALLRLASLWRLASPPLLKTLRQYSKVLIWKLSFFVVFFLIFY
jgi:hypothetical protein